MTDAAWELTEKLQDLENEYGWESILNGLAGLADSYADNAVEEVKSGDEEAIAKLTHFVWLGKMLEAIASKEVWADQVMQLPKYEQVITMDPPDPDKWRYWGDVKTVGTGVRLHFLATNSLAKLQEHVLQAMIHSKDLVVEVHFDESVHLVDSQEKANEVFNEYKALKRALEG